MSPIAIRLSRSACFALALAALAGCTASSGSAVNPVASEDHSTAATGLGLGPQDFRSNGGAFGPDQLSR